MTQAATQPGIDDRIRRDIFVTYLAFILIAAVAVRFDGLLRRDVWLDECCTHFVVQHLTDWPDDGPPFAREVAHTPYFYALRGWVAVFGDTAWGIRSFSAAAGVVGVLTIAIAGASIGRDRVGLIAAALLATHPLHIHYSQEARVYSFWVLLSTCATLLLMGATMRQRRVWWLWYGVSAWLLVLTHYYALLWLPATVVVVLIAANRRQAFRRWLITHALLGVALLPVYVLLIHPHSATGPKLWLREIWTGYPPALAMLRSLWALSPSGGYPQYLGLLPNVAEFLTQYGVIGPILSRWAAPAVVIIVGIAYTAAAVGGSAPNDQDPNATVSRRLTASLAAMVLLFLVTSFLYSLLVEPAYAVGRYDLIALPALLLAIAFAVDAMPTSWHQRESLKMLVPGAITTALCACSLVTFLGARTMPVHRSQTQRAARIAAHVSDADLLVTLGMYRWFMAYEWAQNGFEPEIVSFPPNHDMQLCWDDAEAELASPQRITTDIEAVAGRIRRALEDGRRVWLLTHGQPEGPRWQIDQRFVEHLRGGGLTLRPVDEWAGLIELVPFPR